MALRVKSFEAVQTASTDLNTAAQKYATTLQEIRDLVRELNNVTGGMKIIVIKSPKPGNLSALLKILFPIRKKPV